MSAPETWQQREKRVAEQHAQIEKSLLRIQAAKAQEHGIDIFQPGWKDEYDELVRENEERNARIDSLIGTPHIDEAIADMEEQFEDGSVAL